MNSEQKSYSRILKTSSLIGGAQVINMLIVMVRVKFVAVLIGPVGVGLVGTYLAMVDFIGTITGLGLRSSAVRDIAEAVGSGDQGRIGRIVLTLRRMCWLTGGLGSLLVVLFSGKLSQMTFDSPDYASEISLVGLTILFANVQGGQMALIQGMRRIGDLAKLSVYGVVFGSVISVWLYWWLGKEGIVPAIVVLGVIQLLISWRFARRIEVPKVKMDWMESFQEAGGMVKLGLAFMWSGLLTAGAAYATRALIAHEIDLVAVGIFSAAYGLSGLVVNFVLVAMGADYYPSLTAINHDHQKMRELVNQQTEIGLLLAVPAFLGTLALAPWAIRVFYSAEFWEAAELLRWFSLGCMGRVISWPMGFVMLAKGAAKLFALVQTLANCMHVLLIFLGLVFFGLKGVSIAFFALYVFHSFVVMFTSKLLIGFSWNREVHKLLFVFSFVFAIAFVAGIVLPELPALVVGIMLTAVTGVFCLLALIQRVGTENRVCKLALKIPIVRHFVVQAVKPVS